MRWQNIYYRRSGSKSASIYEYEHIRSEGRCVLCYHNWGCCMSVPCHEIDWDNGNGEFELNVVFIDFLSVFFGIKVSNGLEWTWSTCPTMALCICLRFVNCICQMFQFFPNCWKIIFGQHTIYWAILHILNMCISRHDTPCAHRALANGMRRTSETLDKIIIK